MIRLIATDMDGTLLRENGQLPDGFMNLFLELTKRGVHFAIASGRQYYTLFNEFSKYKKEMIFIAENGALVMKDDNELFFRGFDHNIVRGIITHARDLGDCDIVLCGKKSAYIESDRPEFEAEVKKYYFRNKKVNDLTAIDDDILKVAIYHPICSQEYLYPRFYPKWEGDTGVVVSGKNWMDFGRKDVDKGEAIKHIQRILDVSAMETMVFGDYFNDVPMMKNSYYSYAMENSPEDVKTMARFIAPSNRENGVIKVILKAMEEGII